MKVAKTPPKTMTWPKATLFIAFAAIDDAFRYFFLFFWFFAPIALGTAAAAKTASLGTTVSGAAGAATVAVSAYFGTPFFMIFGTIMSIAMVVIGVLGLTILFLLLNPRIYERNITALPWLLFGIVGSLTITTVKMLHTQIKKEKHLLKEWHKKNDAAIAEQKRRQIKALSERRAAEAAMQIQQEEVFQQEQEAQAFEAQRAELAQKAANDNEEIPEFAQGGA